MMFSLVAAFCCQPNGLPAGELEVTKVEPPNWWVGMKHNTVQLMLYGKGLRDAKAHVGRGGVQVLRYHSVPNDHYAFVDVRVDPTATVGDYALTVSKGQESSTVRFPIRRRANRARRHQGFSAEDIVYLITPDRFANGDPSNDRHPRMLDEYDPRRDELRHGGDLRGIMDHLDHIVDLGCTAIWLNPILENNGVNSYHGYKATDLYQVDERFGGNSAYHEFVHAAHAKGLKVIFDHVSNHIGIRHPWIADLPTEDWLNGTVDNHLSSKHYLLSITDPNADPHTRHELKTFWFVDTMPDLNQRNPFLANYLIQNSLWWIESTGLDGIREDTYPYADQQFLANWAKTIRAEYPRFNIVGEIWALKPAYLAHFQERSLLPRSFETNLPAVMDFPLMDALRNFLKGSGKLRDVHAIYAQDFLYTDPKNLLVFLDNHDSPRALYLADGDVNRVKVALAIMLMGRGIPQLLYGTEINMVGGERHVELRADFPGGFPGDKRNAFDPAERTPEENDMLAYLRRLLHIRRNHPAVSQGRMIHFPPTWEEDVYKFVRAQGSQRIVVLANGHPEQRDVNVSDVSRHLPSRATLRDLLSDEEFPLPTKLSVPGLSVKILRVVQ